MLSELRHFSTSHVFHHKNRRRCVRTNCEPSQFLKTKKNTPDHKNLNMKCENMFLLRKLWRMGTSAPHWAQIYSSLFYSTDPLWAKHIYIFTRFSFIWSYFLEWLKYISLLGNFLIVPLLPFAYVSDLVFVFVFFFFLPLYLYLSLSLSLYFRVRQSVESAFSALSAIFSALIAYFNNIWQNILTCCDKR